MAYLGWNTMQSAFDKKPSRLKGTKKERPLQCFKDYWRNVQIKQKIKMFQVDRNCFLKGLDLCYEVKWLYI